MDIIEKTLSFNNKLKEPQPNKNVAQNENTEEVNYVNIHEIHVNKVIEKKLGTNHFVLLNYELKPITDRLGLLGDHSILFVTFLNQIGSKEHLQFFVKYFPFTESQAQFAEGIGAFEKEALVYKLFKEFSKEGITQASYVVPYCYVVAPKKYFILNDLNTESYQSLNKHICLEYDVIVVVLQALAQLHSSSIAYEEKLKKSLLDLYGNDLEETFFNERKGFPNVEGVESCIKCIVDEIKLFNFPNKLASGKVFTEVADTVCRKIYQIVKPSKTVKNVLTHGDIWTNNILIKYDRKFNKPIGCKLVDFQAGRYAPPAQDVLAFLYLNTRREFRKKYLYELVGMYYSFLEKNLKQCDIKIDSILPFTDFLKSCDEQKLFGVLMSAFYFPLVLISSDEIEIYLSDAELNHKSLFENRIHLVLAHKGKDTNYDERLRESVEDLKELCELF